LPLAAAVVSAFAELSQLFSTVRNPSGTDVLYAVVGALAGGFVFLVLRKRP
jgi:VanZ family protein